MSTSNPYLQTNRWLEWDHLIGLRAWGLVLYGILPTSLFALGILQITTFQIDKAQSLLPFLLVATAPITVLFLLIRQRLIAWYLMRDGLYLRTAILTVMVLLFATLISWAAGLLTGKYVIIPWSDWVALRPSVRWLPLVESILVGIATLVGSTTLFLTAVKDEGGLPGLPSSEFVQDIKALREALIDIRCETIWQRSNECMTETLSKNIQISQDTCIRLVRKSSLMPHHRTFCKDLAKDLEDLEAIVKKLEKAPVKWSDYFGPDIPATLNSHDKALRMAVHKIIKVRVDA